MTLRTHPKVLNRVSMQNDRKISSSSSKPTDSDLNRLAKIIMHAGKFYKGEGEAEDLFDVFERLKNCSCSILNKERFNDINNKFTYKVIDLTNDKEEILLVGGYKDSFTDSVTCSNFTYLLAIKELLQDKSESLKMVTISHANAPRDLVDEIDNIELIENITIKEDQSHD